MEAISEAAAALQAYEAADAAWRHAMHRQDLFDAREVARKAQQEADWGTSDGALDS